MNIMAGLGVAVREFPLATGEAASKFNVSAEEVTEAQLDEIEAEQVRAALLPFHNAQLREILLRPEHQVIDKFTRDQLLTSSFDPEAKQRAETLVTSFRRPIVSGKAIAVGSSTSSLARRYRIQSAIERN